MKRIFFIALFFGMLISYPVSVASGVMIFLSEAFVMTDFMKCNLVNIVLIGAMVGILGGGCDG